MFSMDTLVVIRTFVCQWTGCATATMIAKVFLNLHLILLFFLSGFMNFYSTYTFFMHLISNGISAFYKYSSSLISIGLFKELLFSNWEVFEIFFCVSFLHN